ncbi:Hypothetical predicted protein [Paramuricea clavata]|uniref:Uncharacterized protein n=1 Tax=Paramuricea clavata TaxID=317549 RepID=A0A7D9EML9_PARCT|nr:Hypothetical predicted protein [Paramuricea clavata]
MNPAYYHANLKKKDNSVPRFTLKTVKRYAKVVSVYDGDTCDLVFYINTQNMNQDKPVRYKCRMLGYDAPELEEKPSGELARGYLTHLCTGGDAHTHNAVENLRTEKRVQQKLDDNKNSLVYAEFGGPGKYGRQLVTLYQISKEEEDDSTSCDMVASESSEDNVPPIPTSINTMMAQYINTLP